MSWPGTDIYFSENVLGRKTLSPPVGYFPLSAKMIFFRKLIFSTNAMERYGVKSKQKRCCRSEKSQKPEKKLPEFLEFRGMPRHPGQNTFSQKLEKKLPEFLEFRGMPRHHGKNSIATDRQVSPGGGTDIYFSENVLGRKTLSPPVGYFPLSARMIFFRKLIFFKNAME